MNQNALSAVILITLTASMVSTAAWGFSIHPSIAPSILVLNVNGHIDGTLVRSFVGYFQNHPQPPKYLVIRMNSSGGWPSDATLMGNGLLSFEKFGTRVYFMVDDYCESGCFMLSGYANVIVVGSQTHYGFGHDETHSTVDTSSSNINATSSVINSIERGCPKCSLVTVTLQASPVLGSP